MKAVILEAGAITKGDISWDPVTSLADTVVWDNTIEENKISHIGDAELVLTNKVVMDEDLFKKCPSIKYIGVCATGYNVVDIEACRKRGIAVTFVPAYSTESVAQLCFGLILTGACRIDLHDKSVKQGDWIRSEIFCYQVAPVMELAGKTLGIVGFGNIGRRVADMALAFKMNVIASTAHPEKYKSFESDHLHFTDRETLFRNSDVISLHCPLTSETENMINEESISEMKHGVILVNVSRGGLIDENALAEALRKGQVGYAGVDVIAKEPMAKDDPLLTAPNITITPHIGWASYEARTRLINVIADNLHSFLTGGNLNRIC